MERTTGLRDTALAVLLVLSGSAQAALIDRGDGLIYDDVLDITWTQNANINGQDSWDDQVAWAESLNIFDSIRGVTYDDWRLTNADLNGDGEFVSCSVASESACRDNEFGYLYWQYGIRPGAPGPFTDVQSFRYWTGTEDPVTADASWILDFRSGGGNPLGWNNNAYAWAVRDGDVIPIPAAAWLFGSALGLLGWLRRSMP